MFSESQHSAELTLSCYPDHQPLLLQLDRKKFSHHLPKTLHYYSLPVIPVTEHPQSTRFKCKKHGVKINSVYRLGAHEMEIAGQSNT